MAAAGNDPLADFLARERDEFAVLDDDDTFGGDVNRQPPAAIPQMNGFSDTNGHTVANLVDDNDLFRVGAGADEAQNVTGGALNVSSSSSSLPMVADSRSQTGLTPPPTGQQTVQRVEPVKIKKWREDQKTRLENKDAHEETEKEKWREQAKKEVEEWYKMRGEQLEKTKKSNKTAEQEFIQERDADLPGQEWERISRLCEFNPKASKNSKDVSRMRSLLLQLKSQNVSRD